jgi:hypothetical protein
MHNSNDIASDKCWKPRRLRLQRIVARVSGFIAVVVTRGVLGRRAYPAEPAHADIRDITRIYRLEDNAVLRERSTFPRDVARVQLTGREAALAVEADPASRL